MRIVVVGGVAGGMSAAARARRLSEDAEIIVFERGEYVSFANCGLPYHISEEIPNRASLVLQTPETLGATLNLDVRVNHEVTAIDPAAQQINVQLPDGSTEVVDYDALVLSPGAAAIRPAIDGLDLPQVSTLRTVPDVDKVRELVDADAKRAVVLGAGFIGLEAAEALRHRGLEVDLVDLAPHVLPPLDTELASILDSELTRHGITTRTGVAAEAVTATDGEHPVEVRLSDGTVLPADLVVLSVGVRPDTTLAAQAGLELTANGAIVVDTAQRTSAPHIWAAGDATAVRNAVTDALGPIPLAGPANRQGRRVADSILGQLSESTQARPVLGTAIVRVFDLTAAVVGASQYQLQQAGIQHHVVHLHPGHHAGYFPGAEALHLTMMFATDGRLLGAQAVGGEGADKRIDVLATAMAAQMTADDVAELELAYAPPYGAAKDPVNMGGMIAQNILDGSLRVWHASDLDSALEDALLLDVRTPMEFRRSHLPGAINIAHFDLRGRISEVQEAAGGRPIRVYCSDGFRSYIAHRVLDQSGLDSAQLSGGLLTLRAAREDVPLEVG